MRYWMRRTSLRAPVAKGKEVLVAMLGRVRADNPGRIAVLGKPTYAPYWKDFAENGAAGIGRFQHITTANIPDFDKWVSGLSQRSTARHFS